MVKRNESTIYPIAVCWDVGLS